MQIRLLILGAFVHSLFLLWAYDCHGKTEGKDISCPLLQLNDVEYPRRLILAVLRGSNQKGTIKGVGSEFFRYIPNVIYIGDSSIPRYYENSGNWLKITYEDNWDNYKEDFTFVLDLFHEKCLELINSKFLILLVFHGRSTERNVLFLLDQLESGRRILDMQKGNNSTSVLFLLESDRILKSSGYRVKKTENKLIRSADIVPLISTMLSVDIPYQTFSIVPENYFESKTDLAVAKYCNLLNIKYLAGIAQESIGILKYIRPKSASEFSLQQLNNTVELMFQKQNYSAAILLMQIHIASYISTYINAKQLVNTITFVLMVSSTLCWLTLLCFEYIPLPAAIFVAQSKRYLLHLIFLITSLIFVGIPLSQGWPFTYYLYFQMPLLLLWLAIVKIKSVFIVKFKLSDLNQFLIFSFAILFSVEYLLTEENFILPLSVCLVALLPSIPKFRSIPFLFTFGWYILSGIILCLINVTIFDDLEPGIKYVNFTGTIWLLISGIALLWVQPRFDKILIAFLTACIGIALWLQNICLHLKDHCSILLYCTWPFLAVILLPIFGKTNAIRKLVHSCLTLVIPVLLTSTKLEPLALLIILGYVAGWASIEMLNISTNMDNLRRMLMLIYLLNLTNQLTASEHLSFRCFLCHIYTKTEFYIYILKLVRLTFIYASILTTFRLIIGWKLEAYRTAVLVAIVLAVASLRTIIPLASFSFETKEFDHLLRRYVRINSIATVFIVSYTITMIYARNNKHDIAASTPPLAQEANI